MYGSFWCSMGMSWFLYVIFWAWICTLNVFGFVFDLFGQPVIAHFGTPRSIHVHSQYLSSLFSWVCIDCRLFEITAKSSAYAAELMVSLDVPSVYPFVPLCNHLSNGSKNIKNMYGLSVSPCMGPLCIGIGSVLPKCSPVNIVLDWE